MRRFIRELLVSRWTRQLIALQERERLLLTMLGPHSANSYYFDRYVETREQIVLLEDRLRLGEAAC